MVGSMYLNSNIWEARETGCHINTKEGDENSIKNVNNLGKSSKNAMLILSCKIYKSFVGINICFCSFSHIYLYRRRRRHRRLHDHHQNNKTDECGVKRKVNN